MLCVVVRQRDGVGVGRSLTPPSLHRGWGSAWSEQLLCTGLTAVPEAVSTLDDRHIPGSAAESLTDEDGVYHVRD